MLTQYNLKMPHEIYSGENAMKNLKDILLKNQVKKAPSLPTREFRGPACWITPWSRFRRPVWRRSS